MASDKPKKGKCGALISKWQEKYGRKVYCTRPAGWGTNHPGNGRCKLHGGKSTGPKRSLKYLEKFVHENQKKLIEGYQELPEDERWSLENSLAIGYIILFKAVQEKKLYPLIPRLMESIRRTVETLYKQKYEDEVKVNIAIMNIYTQVVVNAFNDANEIEDPEERRRMFADRIVQAFDEHKRALEQSSGKKGKGNNGFDGNEGNRETSWRLDT